MSKEKETFQEVLKDNRHLREALVAYKSLTQKLKAWIVIVEDKAKSVVQMKARKFQMEKKELERQIQGLQQLATADDNKDTEIKGLRVKIQSLIEDISVFSSGLKSKNEMLIDLRRQHEDVRHKTVSEVRSLTTQVQTLEKKLEYEDVAQAVEKGKEKNKFQFNSDIAIDLTPKEKNQMQEARTNIVPLPLSPEAMHDQKNPTQNKEAQVTPGSGRRKRRFTLARPENQEFITSKLDLVTPKRDDIDKIFSTPARAHESVRNLYLSQEKDKGKLPSPEQPVSLQSRVATEENDIGTVQETIPKAPVQFKGSAVVSLINEEEKTAIKPMKKLGSVTAVVSLKDEEEKTALEPMKKLGSVAIETPSAAAVEPVKKLGSVGIQISSAAGTPKIESKKVEIISTSEAHVESLGCLPSPPTEEEDCKEPSLKAAGDDADHFYFDEHLWTSEDEGEKPKVPKDVVPKETLSVDAWQKPKVPKDVVPKETLSVDASQPSEEGTTKQGGQTHKVEIIRKPNCIVERVSDSRLIKNLEIPEAKAKVSETTDGPIKKTTEASVDKPPMPNTTESVKQKIAEIPEEKSPMPKTTSGQKRKIAEIMGQKRKIAEIIDEKPTIEETTGSQKRKIAEIIGEKLTMEETTGIQKKKIVEVSEEKLPVEKTEKKIIEIPPAKKIIEIPAGTSTTEKTTKEGEVDVNVVVRAEDPAKSAEAAAKKEDPEKKKDQSVNAKDESKDESKDEGESSGSEEETESEEASGSGESESESSDLDSQVEWSSDSEDINAADIKGEVSQMDLDKLKAEHAVITKLYESKPKIKPEPKPEDLDFAKKNFEHLPPNYTIGTKHGRIDSCIENTIIVLTLKNEVENALEVGSIFCFEDRAIMGEVFDLFGTVTEPCYSVAIHAERIGGLKKRLVKGTPVFPLVEAAKWVIPDTLDRTGIDVDEDSDVMPDFSDDEKEAAYLKKKRWEKRQKQQAARQAVCNAQLLENIHAAVKSGLDMTKEDPLEDAKAKKAKNEKQQPPENYNRLVSNQNRRGRSSKRQNPFQNRGKPSKYPRNGPRHQRGWAQPRPEQVQSDRNRLNQNQPGHHGPPRKPFSKNRGGQQRPFKGPDNGPRKWPGINVNENFGGNRGRGRGRGSSSYRGRRYPERRDRRNHDNVHRGPQGHSDHRFQGRNMNAGYRDSQQSFPHGNQGNIDRQRDWDRQNHPLPRNRPGDRGNNQVPPMPNNQQYPLQQQPHSQVKIEQDQGAYGNTNIPSYSQQPYQRVKIEQDRGIPGNRTMQGSSLPNISSRANPRINDPAHSRSSGNGYQSGNFEQNRSRFQRNDNFDLRNRGPVDKRPQNAPPLHGNSRGKFDLSRGRPHSDRQQNQPPYHGPPTDFYSNFDRTRSQTNFQQNSSQFQHYDDGFNSNANRSVPHNDFQRNKSGLQPNTPNVDIVNVHSSRQHKIQPDPLSQQLPPLDFDKPRLQSNLQHNPPKGPVASEFADRARWSISKEGQPPFQQNPRNDPLLNVPQSQQPFSDSLHGDSSRAPSQDFQRQKKSKRVPAALAMF